MISHCILEKVQDVHVYILVKGIYLKKKIK